MKKNRVSIKIEGNRIAWGLLLIACAVLLLLDALGVRLGFLEGIPVITLVLCLPFLAWLFRDIVSLRWYSLPFPLAFLFMLLEKHIAGWVGAEGSNLLNNWLVLLIAVLLSCGAALLRPRKLFSRHVKEEAKNHNTAGNSTVYIDCSSFTTEEVTNELGACQVFFSNVEAYEGGGKLVLHNELGSMKVHVPKEWRIESSLKAELGALMIHDNNKNLPDDAKVIKIEGMTELGSLTVVSV